MRLIAAALLLTSTMACGDDDPAGTADASIGDPDAGPGVLPRACDDLYSQDVLPVMELEIAPEEWTALQTEFTTWREREAAGLPVEPYHPVLSFRVGEDVA